MTQSSEPQGQYLYAIIEATEPVTFNSPGIGSPGSGVQTIVIDRLGAVVSASPMIEYDNTRRNMMAHTLVLEEVMKNFIMLPVRFGTVSPDGETIATKLLKSRYDELTYLLELMRGRAELGLKVQWNDDAAIFNEILEENTAIRSLRDNLSKRPPDKTHFERVKLGEQIAKELARKRGADEQRVLDRLRPFVHKTKLNKTIGEKMVLNAAFLINQADEPALDAAVQELDYEMGSRLQFKYVGPVPPYNFVNISVNWA